MSQPPMRAPQRPIQSPEFLRAHEHVQAGRFEQARPLIVEHLRRFPHDLNALRMAGMVLGGLGELNGLAPFARAAADILKDDPKGQACALACLGAALGAGGEMIGAFEAFDRSLELDPGNLAYMREAYQYRAFQGDQERALEIAEQALKIDPTNSDFLLKRSAALLLGGRLDEAFKAYAFAADLLPNEPVLQEGRAFASNYVPSIDPMEVRRVHGVFGACLQRLADASPHAKRPTQRRVARDQSLRVGMISPDLRTHSVAFFAAALIAHAHEQNIELTVYSTCQVEDETSRRLRASLRAGPWKHLARAQAPYVAEHIRADQPDVLLDLAGLTRDNSMAALALRPAPIIVSALGYPNTTGLPSVQARVVDSITDPPEPHPAQSRCAERLWRLDPCFLCYTPTPDAPAARTPRAAGSTEPITLGCCNALMKLNTPLLALWARVMAQLPVAVLLLKGPGLDTDIVARNLRRRMSDAGIDTARVRLVGIDKAHAEHLKVYHTIDIALDTFPYNGTTTTMEALSMGVPVVTLSGDTHAARVGRSLLTNLGTPELISESPDDYVARVVALANDPARLSHYHSTLRPRVLGSVLCDAPGYAARFAKLLRQIVDAHTPIA